MYVRMYVHMYVRMYIHNMRDVHSWVRMYIHLYAVVFFNVVKKVPVNQSATVQYIHTIIIYVYI